MSEPIRTFRGRDIETLTEAECREALRRTIDTLVRDREFHRLAAEVERDLSETRRVLAGRRVSCKGIPVEFDFEEESARRRRTHPEEEGQ